MKGNFSAVFVLLAAVLWGTTGTAQSYAPDGTHPVVFGTIRLAIGGLFLLLYVGFQGKWSVHNWPVKTVFLAALCMAFYQPFFFSAVSLTGIAVGTVIAIGSAPVIAGILEWSFYRRTPQKNWWAATGLAIGGCILLFANQDSVQIDPLGIGLALLAGASFAGYTLVSKQLLITHTPDTVVAVVFTLSALFLLPLLLVYDLSWITQVNGLATSIYIGIFATAIAYLLFATGLKNVQASTAVTLSLAEPLTAALLGVFLIGESLSILSWTGVGLLFGAILVLSIKPHSFKPFLNT
ncbi:EamA family transporter [Jeotgalibacillus campisalis]|uniref:Transport protein YwfM n=1 Tax=Jeotgalibacillus campisalis TaxID=220754 RepID=A0A0C2S515_9BACL|nr:EamA family transporter [Jeotgalibacillus campisalis]KIL49104.1 transport protein YwfM [Jeotgalibacillus campisalis]